MHVVFDNGERVNIQLYDSPVKKIIEKTFKHLEHVPLPFRSWDHPCGTSTTTQDDLILSLVNYAKKLNIDVDFDRCKRRDQTYFNFLHKIFEENYDGRSDWLDFHEHIHLCESLPSRIDLVLYHREKAGLLIKPMNLSWLQSATTTVNPGDVFVNWAELGKTPYTYWRDGEPDDCGRLCSLAKPWINFFPKLTVSMHRRNFLDVPDLDRFNTWWSSRQETWCKHWNIGSWTVENMFGVIVMGNVDFEKLQGVLKQHAWPTHVRLD